MTPATYILETFGCQMNVLDSQLVEGQLRALGLRRATSANQADLILFNTCSVRQHAEDKVLSRLGRLKTLKRRRPDVLIGVLGCMAERQKEDLFVSTPHLDLICGPAELHRLPELLDEVRRDRHRVSALAGSQSRRTEVLQRALEYDSLEALDLSRGAAGGSEESALQSYIRVQRGCDKFCTYCIVPFTRGPERSRPPEHIVEEARRLAGQGCREATLLGQTVNSYVHQDGGRPVRFAELLERVHAVPGLDRIRFVTSFPADWDEDIFRVMRDLPKICPYLHIPAQSGSDGVLKAMKRGYTVGEYLRLMDTARRYVPDIALAGDFIVGFCGETEGDFQASVDLVRRVEYKNIFVFKYSPRPGTAADRSRADDVPAAEKARRNNELLAVQAEIGLRQRERLIGQAVEVLVEGYSKLARKARGNGDGDGAAGRAGPEVALPDSEQSRGSEAGSARSRQLVGRTPHDLIVVFDGGPEHIGALARVRIESATALTLFGRIESASPTTARPRSGAGPHAAITSLPQA
ncbi:MAG: tRNA (N6-isopentenyl adenosine(37)-C2)-methylthiotransferase MiaB [Planctomycetota bacterium]